MNDKNRDGYVDDLLDRSLSQYARVEPRAGLEERLLVQVRSARQVQPRRSMRAWYLVPAAVAATALLMVGIQQKENEPASSGAPVAAVEFPAGAPSVEMAEKSPAATIESPADRARSGETVVKPPIATRALPDTPSASAPAKSRAQPIVLAAEISRPKQDLFPTPEPLSDMDRILLRLLRDNSPTAAQALSRLPTANQVLEKIQVAELVTPPITLEPIAITSLETEK